MSCDRPALVDFELRRKTLAGRDERALEVGLFRYALIREAADLSLSGRERGVLVRVRRPVSMSGLTVG